MYHPRLQSGHSPLSPILPMGQETSSLTPKPISTFNFSPGAVSRHLMAASETSLTPMVLKKKSKDKRRSFSPYLGCTDISPGISPIEYVNIPPTNTPTVFFKSLDNSTSSKKSPRTPNVGTSDNFPSISVHKVSKQTITICNEFGEIIQQDEEVKDKQFVRSPVRSDNSSESFDSFRSSFSSFKSYQKYTPESAKQNSDLNKNVNVEILLNGIGLGKYETLFKEEKIDMEVFLNLTDEDLIEIGVMDKNDRELILSTINDFFC